eukprot:gnl/TRDRNA2_/TRDRNA2_151798_c0_seq1.p1 gnl/TRDRNA2_/TRDRNA2_151798_c0~~gnl/TRDRNA2_/TRDRNA2_151798_c0_seq1.p1  ORF type:complete len:454 (+),score=48.17 gnl/TRDRNA2_/TRDRNA2_151798_c0_seq1:89-1450(+)
MQQPECQHYVAPCELSQLKQCNQCTGMRYRCKQCQLAAWKHRDHDCRPFAVDTSSSDEPSQTASFIQVSSVAPSEVPGDDALRSPGMGKKPCSRCLHCAIIVELKCSGCGSARYCSEECQIARWGSLKEACRDPSASDGLTTERFVRLLPHLEHKAIFTSESGDECISLVNLVKSILAKNGDGLIVWMFKDNAECEDTTLEMSMSCHRVTCTSAQWTRADLLAAPALGWLPFPSLKPTVEPTSLHLLFTQKQIAEVLERARSSPKDVFALLVIVGATKNGEDIVFQSNSAFSAIALPFCSATSSCGGKRSSTLRTSESSYALARKLESDSSFQECRKLLFQIQELVDWKGIFCLRQLSEPELTQVTPSSLQGALRQERRRMSEEMTVGGGIGQVSLLPLHGETLEKVYEVYPHIPIENLLQDKELKLCHGFLLTYHDEHSDWFVLTPFHFEYQ